ncbi:MAG TPA: hypothetical protein EYG68_12175 [Leucothrix mucor]|nr:hypothetical protein [Leucothrix mucor]
MSNTPILHVLIPDLLSPLKLWNQDFGFVAVTNETVALLAQHQRNKVPFSGLDSSLFSLLGFSPETEIPYAFYRAKKERLKTVLGEHKGTILCADPVHLKAGLSEIMMDRHDFNDLSDTDADSLLELLNQHFFQDGLQFVKGSANRWYLLLANDDSIRTTPLREMRAKDISKKLPQSDRINLHKIQNEIQMLLHSSEVNQRREQEGKLAINSLWFWGGGTTLKARTRVRSVIGGGLHGEVVASVADCRYLVSAIEPEKELSEMPAGGHHLLILDQLTPFALSDDLDGWQQELNKLEKIWLAPVEKFFNKGKLKVLLHSCDGSVYIPKKTSVLNKLWRKVKGDNISLLALVGGGGNE